MKGHATIQCRAKLSKGGIRRLDRVRSILNRLYNAALEERRTAWESEQRGVTLYDQMKGLTSQRKDDPEGLGSVAVKAERGMLMRLDRAFKAFFRRCKAGEKPGYPRFRPIARMETIDVVDPKATMVKKRARGYAIRPKGFPTIRIFPSRPLPDRCPLKALRIVRKPNRVYVDLTYEVEKPPLPKCESSVGIDLGVRKRAVLSTGERIERNRRDWAGIRKQQRKVSRCKKISKTRRKRIVQLSRLRHRESVRNRNACHRLSSRIIREHGLIAVEKLNIQGMVTKGSKKKGLNREIMTQSWGLLRNQLQYKAEWAGRGVRRSESRIYLAGLPPVRRPPRSRTERNLPVQGLRTWNGQGPQCRPEHSQGWGSCPGHRNVSRWGKRGARTVCQGHLGI